MRETVRAAVGLETSESLTHGENQSHGMEVPKVLMPLYAEPRRYQGLQISDVPVTNRETNSVFNFEFSPESFPRTGRVQDTNGGQI